MTFTPDEQKYFTNLKMRINYSKHYQEDAAFKPEYELPYKTLRYIRKLAMRKTCAELKPELFATHPDYEGKQIWDLKYISTSDEEDNDSSEGEGSGSSSSSSEESKSDTEQTVAKGEETILSKDPKVLDEEGKVDPKKIWKLEPGKNEGVP